MNVSKDKPAGTRVTSQTTLKKTESTFIESTDKEKKRSKKWGKKRSSSDKQNDSAESLPTDETDEKDDKKKSKKKNLKGSFKNNEETTVDNTISLQETGGLCSRVTSQSYLKKTESTFIESTDKEKKRSKKWGKKRPSDEDKLNDSAESLATVVPAPTVENETDEKDDKKKSKKKNLKGSFKNTEETSVENPIPVEDPTGLCSGMGSQINLKKTESPIETTDKEKKRSRRWGRKRSSSDSAESLATVSPALTVENETEEKKKGKKKNVKGNVKLKGESSPTGATGVQTFPLHEYCGIKYRLVKTEKFEDYLKAMSMNVMTRRMALKFVPTLLVLDYDGTDYTLLSSSLFLHLEVKFSLGRSFDMTTPDGRVCSVVFTYQEPNILVEIQKGIEVHTITRIFRLNSVHMSLALNNVVCKMTFLPCTTLPNELKTIHSAGPRPTIYEYSKP